MEQKLKQRICIEFCVKLQISATETFEMLNKAFPNDPPKRTTVFEWHSRFKAGRISIEDDPCQGRPKFQRTDENVQKITDLIKENPRTTLLELEQDTSISKTTIGRIVTEDLKLKKTPAKFIPRFLTNEQNCVGLQLRLTPGFHRRVKAKTSFQDDDVPIDDDTTTKLLFTPQEKDAKVQGTKFQDFDGILGSSTSDPYLKLAEFPLKMNLGKDAQNVQKITDLIKENPRTTLLELEQDTGISKTTIGRIVTKDLKLKKTPAKFIPRFLTNEQKLCRLATCENMLEMTRTDPEWKDKIITGDETWVYDYDPETKRQYAEWRGQGEPRPKKSRILKSRNKVLLVAFLDNKGIVHHEYLPAGQTVIKEMYLDILRHLREAIRKKMPEKWPNGDWILHHNNARPHTAHLVTSFFFAKNGTEILPQPPYSPDIAPNDFFLFPKLKAVLKGRHFDTRDDIIEKSLLALKSIPKELYKNCFDNLGKQLR
ncbi:hypothetical protein LAZ67_6004023 [Cordylochernes scorpioides]|uniref:Mos1 transposase HTH domain-containing protein n=1 Tax=Cordylochernes scorpioides TaxID=51811 RepID=A0ABY6KPA9_9ARAC|nr:hypothetical protein LAZ67_6004023 [Cordylochernes scorpioides]